MSGKRAKPSPWRFVRLVPVALVAMVVCAMLGLFLLLQDPGDEQAHDRALDPVPSSSQDPGASDPESAPDDSPSSSTSATTTPSRNPMTAPEPDASPVGSQSPEPPAPEVRRKRVSASVPATQPVHQPTKAPTSEPIIPAAGPARDNPGKKKGLRKGHGPHGHKNR